MALTGWALIALAVFCTAAVAAGTVLVWGRWGRLRYLTRPAGVLLAEALLLVSIGLVVNRQQQFYPSWAALVDSGTVRAASFRTAAGGLDRELAAQAGAGDGVQRFAWHPAGLAGWRLAGPPEVVTPAGYLRHPQWRYSVVLVVGETVSDWAAAGQAVMVYATPAPGTQVQALVRTLPVELGQDLRVTAHRWALVTSVADAPLADRIALAARGVFPAIATVRGARAATKLPVGIATGPLHAGLTAAIAWAAGQTPPPLAASAPPVTYLPDHRKVSPSGSPSPRRSDVAGQRRS